MTGMPTGLSVGLQEHSDRDVNLQWRQETGYTLFAGEWDAGTKRQTVSAAVPKLGTNKAELRVTRKLPQMRGHTPESSGSQTVVADSEHTGKYTWLFKLSVPGQARESESC